MNDNVLRFDADKAKGTLVSELLYEMNFQNHSLYTSAACSDILAAFNQPTNAEKLQRARESAGNDMIKVMREVFPIVTAIQLEVVKVLFDNGIV